MATIDIAEKLYSSFHNNSELRILRHLISTVHLTASIIFNTSEIRKLLEYSQNAIGLKKIEIVFREVSLRLPSYGNNFFF